MALHGSIALVVGGVHARPEGKDYIASFTSVRDLEQLGVEGRRAHMLVLSVIARVGL